MKSNYDRSKSISRKTTKNYHPRADDPLLLKICRHVSTVQYRITVQYSSTVQYSICRHVSTDMSDISVEAKLCFV